MSNLSQERGIGGPALAALVLGAGGVTLVACIAWAISRTSGLSSVSGGELGVALAVLVIGLLPFVLLVYFAPALGRIVTLAATTVFGLVVVVAYSPSMDSATGGGAIGHPVRICTTLLVLASFALIGVSEGVRVLHRSRAA